MLNVDGGYFKAMVKNGNNQIILLSEIGALALILVITKFWFHM